MAFTFQMANKALLVYLIFVVSVALCSFCDKDNPSYEDAVSFIDDFNRKATQFCKRENVAMWNLYMDLTEENQEILGKETEDQKTFLADSAVEAASCAWQSLSDPVLRRQFEILDQDYKQKLSPEEADELLQASDELQGTYIMATVCQYDEELRSPEDYNNCTMTLDDMIPVLETSTNVEELVHYWTQWRQATGNELRDTYLQFVALSNKEARLNSFSDVGEKWRSHYETENFAEVLENLLENVRPLYQQLHAYVRKKLMGVYEGKISCSGPLPAHLLGYEVPNNWINLEKLIRPYPNKPIMDITPLLEERNLTALDMVRMADDFFQSLGLDPMRDEFWNNSALVKLEDQFMICHPQAFDFCDGKDFRIRMCVRSTMDDLRIIHHEMGHVQYAMLYSHLPYILRQGANDGFHEAIGDTIGLSLFTTSHWKTLGFMDNNLDDDAEQEINSLLRIALDRLPILPYTFALEKWRWGLFDGSITSDNANTKWWEYNLEYLGVCPPVKRTEQSLDAMELFQVAVHYSVDRYFVSDILQFQLHKALCDASGYEGPLHKCDIYGSVEAGTRLKNMLSLGRSKPWGEALKAVTGGDTDHLDAQPLLDYFQPLYLWLKEQNENELVGWSSEDPTVCP